MKYQIAAGLWKVPYIFNVPFLKLDNLLKPFNESEVLVIHQSVWNISLY